MNYRYFELTGTMKEHCLDFFNQNKVINDQREVLKNEIGALNWVGEGKRLIGFVFDFENPPDDHLYHRRVKPFEFWIPKKKLNPVIFAKMRSLDKPDVDQFFSTLGLVWKVIDTSGGLTIHGASLLKDPLNSKIYVAQPLGRNILKPPEAGDFEPLPEMEEISEEEGATLFEHTTEN